MDCILKHSPIRQDGQFGDLQLIDNSFSCKTLEHAYQTATDGLQSKIPPGVYRCDRGDHELAGMTETFSTFEVTGVRSHTGILFHWGNYNKDSDGCILLGKDLLQTPSGQMIGTSRFIFAKFMQAQKDVTFFMLTVL